MRQFFLFIGNLFIVNSGKSSKRFFGSIILMSVLVHALIQNDFSENKLDILTTLIYVGAALLGLGILDKFKTFK